MEESMTVRVVDEVASLEGVNPLELPPLYDTIDADTLEALFTDSVTGGVRENIRVEFDYCGYEVVVKGPDDIQIDQN